MKYLSIFAETLNKDFFLPVLKGLSDTEKQETVGRNLTPKSSVPL